MDIFRHTTREEGRFWRQVVTRVALVLTTTFLIVWFLPKSESKRFAYEVGEPWRYGTIIAKYDFPIYKTEEALKGEKDSLLRQFQPYYNYVGATEAEQMAKFNRDFPNGLPGMSAAVRKIVLDRLHRLYQVGIMETPDYNRIAKTDTAGVVRVISGKNAEPLVISCIYSTRSAYEQLINDRALASERAGLQRLNLNNYIEPNLVYDKARTETARNDMLSGVSPASGMVLSGQKIISVGDMVNEYNFRVLASLEREMERRNANESQLTNMLIGNTLYVLILVTGFTFFILLYRKDFFEKPRNITMLYVLITLYPILVSLMMQHSYFNFSIYVLPFAFVPIFVRVFIDSRTAFITHVITVLLCSAPVRFQYEFIIIQIVAGLVAIYSLREMSSRSQVFRTALFVCMAMSLTYMTLKLMQSADEFTLDTSMYYHFMINGVLLLLIYPLMFLVEKTFGFTSPITLIELSNTNKGLLRNLSEVAPGTFQHSITVGNLAAEIANRIDADSTLVRTGALYHDIGKMINPVFFTENQQGGINPHDNISDKESARIIIEHVTNGIRIAEEAGLPVYIVDFIRTHHGRGLVKYFYVKYQNEHPDEIVDKEQFTYPGPNPSTIEQAILMMADTCEAASHSLKEYSEETIGGLVNTLIDDQVRNGFFRECKITFYDIDTAKLVLIERLKAIYHTRIQYPKSNREEQGR